MEKVFEPTPEMKAKLEAAKTRVKTHEVQELSVDDLENVSGGYDYIDGVPYVYVNDPEWGTMSVDDYYELVKWAYDNYGLDIAINFALDIDPSVFNERALQTGGPEYMRDTLKSRIIHAATGENFNPWSIWGTWG